MKAVGKRKKMNQTTNSINFGQDFTTIKTLSKTIYISYNQITKEKEKDE
jgi:hypothetical protein